MHLFGSLALSSKALLRAAQHQLENDLLLLKEGLFAELGAT